MIEYLCHSKKDSKCHACLISLNLHSKSWSIKIWTIRQSAHFYNDEIEAQGGHVACLRRHTAAAWQKLELNWEESMFTHYIKYYSQPWCGHLVENLHSIWNVVSIMGKRAYVWIKISRNRFLRRKPEERREFVSQHFSPGLSFLILKEKLRDLWAPFPF